jgi:hypothetical protein
VDTASVGAFGAACPAANPTDKPAPTYNPTAAKTIRVPVETPHLVESDT